MKIINIVAGGPRNRLPSLSRGANETWIAVDRGLEHMLFNHIEPDFILGDFDSVSRKLKRMITQRNYKQFPSEKDQTDLEIAVLHALEEKAEVIMIYGATGGRLDHELMNIQLLLRSLNCSSEVFIVDKQNKITLKKPGSYQIVKSDFKYISFLSLYEKVENLTLAGFKYPLKEAELRYGSSLCVSNELILSSGTFSFTSGILILVESCD